MEQLSADKLSLFNDQLPLAQASTIPSSWYSDPEIYHLERKALFNNSWQFVGHLEQVKEPGQFFTFALAGEPVLIVRDKSNKLRAFSNVCRHRAARVECRDHGKASLFSCRYHGWAYGLDGNLCGTPEFEGVSNFGRDKHGLPPLAIDTFGQFIFVNMNPNAEPLAELLKPLAETNPPQSISEFKFVARKEYNLECNWKLFVDNYLDGGYHIATVHKSLAKVVNYSGYYSKIAGKTCVQVSPLTKAPESENNKTLNAVRGGDVAYYWWVFPNLMLNIYQDFMDVNIVLPIGQNQCRVIFDFYFRDADKPSAIQNIEESMRVAHQIQLEDIDICEEVHRGLTSFSYTSGRFSVKREKGGYYFHQLLARAIRSAST